MKNENVLSMNLDVFAIKTLMATKRLTGTELAFRSGMSRQGLFDILKRGRCTVVSVGKISEALGVTIEEILISDERREA